MRFYVLNDLEGYGSGYPVCISEKRVRELNSEWEWGTTMDDWHEASQTEIEEYGVEEE